MRSISAVILGGGRGTRLQPLTTHRSKPAVPLAGKYRLIDIPISNCINSGINRCYVLTQFLSVSLHSHIRGTYRFDAFSGGLVEILAAQQTLATDDDTSWYQGTADAVRKNLRYFTDHHTDHVLILSGDQLYRMDFSAMLKTHEESGAAITIAAKPVHRHEAKGLGIMKVDESGRVIGFVEKPTTNEQLDEVAMDPAWVDSLGVTADGRECMASMGIYLFSADVLTETLNNSTHSDFGKELLPEAIANRHVQLHPFDGYWEDIGTIGSFYDSNLALCKPDAPFDLGDADAPIYSRPRFLPPTRADGAEIKGSLIADGCTIHPGAKIENSIIGLRCQIGSNVTIRDSIVMGADFFETPEQVAKNASECGTWLGIGEGAVVERAIVDKNCRIGAGARVSCESKEDLDLSLNCCVRDGVLVVPKNTIIPPGWSPK
ncbi:glucose-1-phosphate adenylyltransferase [Aeoliella mucimassa]|uniref:Glucose-1-phosphate adenylyltransferase n=1 Tax=Aeoliella mucimassa TaxID=2527972 RepID=A0A518ASX5_9BACT|nr:glucose-1-phosphate adenylyltransferase [Aeoliella mucimassa]QDU57824.1 Glucose-1-phosphate adenylyltransferase [Aeoliella mucimassa]